MTMALAALLLCMGTALAQTKISGKVLADENGEPIVGASVKVTGTSTGMATDIEGAFSITLPQGKTHITVSYLGMVTQELAAKDGMVVRLVADNQSLDEVVVVAYGTAKRHSITGSVSVVDKEKLKDRIQTSVTGALEGAAPGIQVNNSYGEPGASPSIRIRGIGSLVSGAQSPLYILDGVPFDGNISEINPNDIDNISVLKDASSAALYGNRAANGVILITTKRGSGTAKPVVNLKIGQGVFSRGIPEYEKLGPDSWMHASWIAMKNFAMTGKLGLDEANAAAYASARLIPDYVKRNIYGKADGEVMGLDGFVTSSVLPGYDDLDWTDQLTRTGHRQEYNISGSMASEKFNFYSSAGYLNEQGYVKGIGYERFSGKFNSTYTPVKWFQGGINLMATMANRSFNENATGSMYANPFSTARYMAPVYPTYLHNDDGTYMLDNNGQKIYDTKSSYLSNRHIVYELGTDSDRSRRAYIDGQIFGTLTLPYGFSFTMKGDWAHSNTNRKTYGNPEIGDGAANNGRLGYYAYEYDNSTLQELLNWSRDFGVHHVDALLGHENYSWKREYVYGMNTGMAVDNNLTMGNFLTNSSFIGSADTYKTESYLGRVRYNFDEKYFADASFRRDGSSRFHPDNRWGNFFSFGLNWNAKKENFLKDVSWVDALRVRASYGEVGNDAGVDLYGYMALYQIEKNAGVTALMKRSLSAKEIKWETTQTVDLGIEGQLFGRLNFDLGYFDKRSKDLLFEVRLPLSAGSYVWQDNIMNLTQYKNIGTISNRGFEMNLNGDVVRTKDWKWNLSLDATFLDNKIVKLPDGKDIIHGLQNYSEGHDAYEFYTYHFEGVDQMTGQSLYTIDTDQAAAAKKAGALTTINGVDYTTQTSFAKRDWAGTALPTVYGSIGSNLGWKDLSLSMLFTYSLGGKVYDGTYQSLMSTSSVSSASANHADILNGWNGIPEGMTETSADRIDPNGTPAIDFNRSQHSNASSDRWLTSASYFVFKNISLSYSLPKSLVSKLGVAGATLTAGAENLFSFTSRKGLNPQYSFSGGYDDTYVTARVFNFGLSLTF